MTASSDSARLDSSDPIRFVVVGVEHLHAFELVGGLVEAGAVEVGHWSAPGPLTDLYRGWRPDSASLDHDQALAAGADLVVVAGVPNERAGHAAAALRAGASVLSDKPGVTTHDQLDAVLEAERGHAGRWWVLFSERFGNRAVLEAVRRVHDGAIGRIVDVVGLGPHTLAADQRPPWFWSPETSGGILGDLATHQIDQFCALVDPDGAADITVTSSSVGNVSCPDHPAMQDIGRLTLAGAGAVGAHRVDYLTAAGLDSWGDCRLLITGTEGSLEVRANVDPGGAEGGEHLIQVDASGTTRIDTSGVTIDWADRLLADVRSGTDILVSPAHVERVCRLALDAQSRATPWAGS
ncbi:MAG: Gfo/Idh/MocA family oxidoreductase [Acidimicrobiales bacterium]|nr:Gfo/Idh/MocA family oxidoreductase [Acidimicrobiales bacterium]